MEARAQIVNPYWVAVAETRTKIKTRVRYNISNRILKEFRKI
jgi:hypothetical protein